MYNENNNGMMPWKTSDKTWGGWGGGGGGEGVQSDLTPFTTTRCCLLQRKYSIHFFSILSKKDRQ